MSKTRPTSADVAREARVSRATVSYVLNNRADVRISPATRAEVFAAAERLGYQPSPAARALRAGRSDIVLLLVPDWETTGQFGRFLEALGHLISQQGFVCLRYEGSGWQGHLGELLGKVPAAAVVTLGPLSAKDADAMSRSSVPEVPAWPVHGPEGHTIRIDQAAIVELQVDRLLSRGARALLYVVVPDERNRPFFEARVEAFRRLSEERGVSADVLFVNGELVDFVNALQEALREGDSPVGVCAWNDVTALGVLSAARAMNIRVPHELAVIGVDDTAMAPLTDPPLTSVAFDLVQDASLIAAKIANALGVPHPEKEITSSPMSVVIRGSG